MKGGLFTIFSFITQGFTFLLLILLARYISPFEYGKLSLFNTVIIFLGLMITISTHGYLSISYVKNPFQEFRKDFTSVVFVSFGMFCVFSVALLVKDEFISNLFKLPVKILWIALLISFLQVFITILLDLLRLKEKIFLFGSLSTAVALLNFLITIILVSITDLSWKGRIVAQFIVTTLFSVIAVFHFLKQRFFTTALSRSSLRSVLLFGLPLVPHNASNWLRQGLDRYIVSTSYSLEDVGIFSFALNIVNIIVIIGTAFNSTYSVTVYRLLASDISNKKEVLAVMERKLIQLFLVTSSIVTLFGAVLIPLILPQYIKSIPYFLILASYGFLNCIYFVFVNYLFYFERTKHLMNITFFSAIFHLCASFILTEYSLVWTCLVYVFSQALIVFFVWRSAKRILSLNL